MTDPFVRRDASVARRGRAALWVAAVGGAATLGCGGGAPQVQVTSPFTEEHAAAFENGVDYIDDPTILEGSWLRSWEDDIDRRVSLADAIALVTVVTFREDVDLDRRLTYRLVARVDRRRHGDVPDEITLVARPDDPGVSTVRGNERRILDQRFVAFLKWVERDGQIEARWHLSPAGDRVLRRVNTLVERRHTAPEHRRRIIVTEHEHSSEREEGEIDGEEADD